MTEIPIVVSTEEVTVGGFLDTVSDRKSVV